MPDGYAAHVARCAPLKPGFATYAARAGRHVQRRLQASVDRIWTRSSGWIPGQISPGQRDQRAHGREQDRNRGRNNMHGTKKNRNRIRMRRHGHQFPIGRRCKWLRIPKAAAKDSLCRWTLRHCLHRPRRCCLDRCPNTGHHGCKIIRRRCHRCLRCLRWFLHRRPPSLDSLLCLRCPKRRCQRNSWSRWRCSRSWAK